MNFNNEESEWLKTKTSENFKKKMLIKNRQFSNDIYNPEEIKDFTRFTEMININILGSQPIVIYKKIKGLQSPIDHTKKNNLKEQKVSATSREKIIKKVLKNNYLNDRGLPQKINKYKNKFDNHHSQSPSKKIRYSIKSKSNTNREKKNTKNEKTKRGKNKTKEYIPKTSKGYNVKQIFKKVAIQNQNNIKKEWQKKEDKENSKYMTDKNTIEQDDKKKKEFINNLIKNGVACFKKNILQKKIKMLKIRK